MATFKFTIHSPFVGADVVEEIEIDDEELEGLSEKGRNDHIDQALREWVESTIEFDWEEV